MRCGFTEQLNAASCSFLDLLEQSNSHLNLAYQILQAQHLLNSASERYFSNILTTSLSLSLELARKQVYTSHIHQHPILISFYFFWSYLSKVTSKVGHLNQSTARPIQQSVGVVKILAEIHIFSCSRLSYMLQSSFSFSLPGTVCLLFLWWTTQNLYKNVTNMIRNSNKTNST